MVEGGSKEWEGYVQIKNEKTRRISSGENRQGLAKDDVGANLTKRLKIMPLLIHAIKSKDK